MNAPPSKRGPATGGPMTGQGAGGHRDSGPRMGTKLHPALAPAIVDEWEGDAPPRGFEAHLRRRGAAAYVLDLLDSLGGAGVE